MEDNKPEEVIEVEEVQQDETAKSDKDLQIESLQELLSELKEANKSLTAEVNQMKKEQIKITEMVGKKETDDGELFSIFDRYNNKGGK